MARRVLISIAVLFALLCGAALAEQAEVVDSGECGKYGSSVSWTLDSEGTLTISGKGEMADNFSQPWNEYRKSIQAVVINDGVTSIGNWSFSNCTNLASVTIPQGLTSIGDFAFENCTGLTSVTIPQGVTDIGEYTFKNCASLTEIRIPEGISLMDYCVFGNCAALQTVYLPGSVTTIENTAFYRSYNVVIIAPENSFAQDWARKHSMLPENKPDIVTEDSFVCAVFEDTVMILGYTGGETEVEIPAYVSGRPVTEIGDYAFDECEEITSVHIPEGVTRIGEYAFSFCTSLASINIPDSVTFIGEYAFECCESLTEIVIPEGVTSISDRTFGACFKLARVVLPDGLTSIGDGAFSECRLSDFIIPDSVTSIGTAAFDSSTLTSITIPSSVTRIEGMTFYGCHNLVSITIPDSVTFIDESAFESCNEELVFFAPANSHAASWATEHGFRTAVPTPTEITQNGVVYSIADGEAKVTGHTGDLPADVELPESVAGVPLTAIGSEAFSYCQNLRSLRIPEGVTTIDMLALSYSGLETIYLPRSVTFIDDSAFEACSDALVFVAPSDSYAAQRAGELGYMCFESKPRSIVGYNLRYFLANDEITVVRCAEDAASVDVPAEVLGYPVTAIARGAFSYCASLTELALPDTIRSIGNEAFWGCDGLTDVRIPDSVTRIGSYAFGCCSNLASIDLPNRLSSLGTSVFYNCPSLKKVDLPQGIDCIPSETFGFCDGLTEVTIPEGVTSIGNLAFEECRSLTAVALPDSLTILDEGAFYGCTSLTRITLPYGTTTLEACAFGRCTGLTEVGLPATVTRIDDYAFEDCDSKLKIYAPSGCPAYDWANARDMLLTMWFVSENDISYVLIDNTAVVIGHEGDPSALTIPAQVYGLPVDGLDEQALAFCERMTSISLPDSLTFIGNEAFHFCSRLPSITIPEGVTEIGSYAFSYCLRLTEAALPDSLTTIGDRAFAECEALPGITIPKNVTSIDSGAFSNCTGLGWITFLGRDAISIAEDAIPESVTICCYRDSAVERWALENGYTCESIDEHIHSLVIDPAVPATHATPGRTMGMRCTECGEVLIQSEPIPVVDVDKLVLPAQLETIEEEAFANDSIVCVVIPDGCKAIGAGAFRGCMELCFIEIPSSVASIDGTAFEDCDNDLIIVTAPGSEAQRFAQAKGITCVLLD